MEKILIKNGTVWDGKRFFESDVLTVNDLVAKIEPNIQDTADFTYDATGCIVSAGFVDAHVHILVNPTDRYGMPADIITFPFGVTAAADAGRENGNPAILEASMVKNAIFVSVQIRDNQPDISRLEKALALYGSRAIGIKVYFDIHVSEVRDATPLEQICRFAKKRGLIVMVHCSNSPVPMADILEALNPGDILTHAFHGEINTARDDSFESMRRAKERGVIIDTGFAGYVHTDFSIFRQAIDAGVLPDTISTDITKFSAYIRGGRYGMTLCMSIARHAGMSEEEIFKAVTSAPARALGKSDLWGTLEVGKPADIAVVKYTDEGYDLTDAAGNNIKSNNGYRCLLTLSNGLVVYSD